MDEQKTRKKMVWAFSDEGKAREALADIKELLSSARCVGNNELDRMLGNGTQVAMCDGHLFKIDFVVENNAVHIEEIGG